MMSPPSILSHAQLSSVVQYLTTIKENILWWASPPIVFHITIIINNYCPTNVQPPSKLHDFFMVTSNFSIVDHNHHRINMTVTTTKFICSPPSLIVYHPTIIFLMVSIWIYHQHWTLPDGHHHHKSYPAITKATALIATQ